MPGAGATTTIDAVPTIDYHEHLRELPRTQWPGYLSEHSGLPGPRANLALLHAVGDLADPSMLDTLISSDDEYLLACGVAGLGGRLAAGGDVAIGRMHAFASDSRWRVREAVAMAIQRFGDDSPARAGSLAVDWAADPDPLVRRAAVAGICEPRLLRTPAMAALAIRACQLATESLAGESLSTTPPADAPAGREARRVLRQALGYCWSVAIAADPEPGLIAFAVLRTNPDPDVRWVVRENLGKKRLARLL